MGSRSFVARSPRPR
ncbi:unnamed protein product [Linum tenue]|uniref:Uncharacterized protein n=1 Tax=Linum tenue TaxID=586396 RepID=A0AAV0S840_9ROSI|nr:unnamed protein product [Linum tenue]